MKYFISILIITIFTVACNNTPETPTELSLPETEGKVVTQRDIEEQSIKKYLNHKELQATEAESGLFYIIHGQGDGEPIDDDDDVTFDIIGKFLNDSEFYSSKTEGQPLGILIGQNMVVAGLEEGLRLLNKGGEATLYIPSHLAYGEEGSGSLIPPNTVLVYEVEVLSVKKY